MARKRALPRLEIRNFAQIKRADIELGDLTVFVGPQATGKSLALQLLGLCLNGEGTVHTLKEHGFGWQDAGALLEHVLGEGMENAWSRATRVRYGGRPFSIAKLAASAQVPLGKGLLYIPAQRGLVIIDGWPRGFRDWPLSTPFVVRQFSDLLVRTFLKWVHLGNAYDLAPGLDKATLQAIDAAFFHGARLNLQNVRGKNELRLAIEGGSLPTMAWTAGQREFAPLLTALNFVFTNPSRLNGKTLKLFGVDWIVIEEPEMGLHPKAILAVMLIVLELLARGYKVVLSTHHPLVLDVVWALRRIQQSSGPRKEQRVLEVFGLSHARGLHKLAAAALKGDYRVSSFDFTEGGVVTTDISTLDPGSDDDAVAGWGGLSGLSGHIGDVVAAAVSR